MESRSGCWGVITMGFAGVQNYPTVLALRLLIGVVSGIFLFFSCVTVPGITCRSSSFIQLCVRSLFFLERHAETYCKGATLVIFSLFVVDLS